MNKLIKYSGLFFVVSGLFVFSACNANNYKQMEEYCYMINSMVKDIDFHTATITEGEVILYDDKYVEIKEMSFEGYENDKKIIGVRKEGAVVYFIINGSVDDEQGIIFINDDSNSLLDGIKSIERIGGNSYHYSTYG